MSESSLLNEIEAKDFVAGIGDSHLRTSIGLLLAALIEFHRKDPTRLRGAFDLFFFVKLLRERINDISILLQGETPLGYWDEDDPQLLPVDEASDIAPTGLRQRQAFNYSVSHEDKGVRNALLSITALGNLKQILHNNVPKKHEVQATMKVVPEVPSQPFDFLFMAMALDNALSPGQPARLFLGV